MNTVNTSRLRAIIGWLAIALPWLVCLIIGRVPASISATYYTNACPVFMIVLGSACILLFCYHGYDIFDDLLNSLAALAGLCVCLFPCNTDIFGEWPFLGTFKEVPVNASATIHNVSAAVFFGLLAINSLFRFTKSSGEMTANKRRRNVIYKVCGWGMVASFPILAVERYIPWNKVTWLVEAIALFFFGISWLTKADRYWWLFADTPDDIFSKIFNKTKEET